MIVSQKQFKFKIWIIQIQLQQLKHFQLISLFLERVITILHLMVMI